MHSVDRLIANMGTKLEVMEEAFHPQMLRSYLAEFISTFIFVFFGVGSAISAGKITADISSDEASLVAIAMAHAFALFVAIYASAHVSGGHVNPAVTLGLAIGGHISILNGIFYWVAQLLGSTIACLILMLVTAGQVIPTHRLGSEITGVGGVVMESITTFALVYTVYATRDLKGPIRIMGPLAIGFVVGAGILASGPFTGGSMNPARSFGPALITGDFKHHGVYWVGPLMGGAVAGFVYEHIFSFSGSQPCPSSDDVV